MDTEGNAANNVETEQIAQFESGVCSFVQVRFSTDYGPSVRGYIHKYIHNLYFNLNFRVATLYS